MQQVAVVAGYGNRSIGGGIDFTSAIAARVRGVTEESDRQMEERGFDFEAEYGARYDRIIRQVVPGYEHLHPMILSVLRTLIGSSARILVVGVGSGSELLTFAGAEPAWKLTGVEPASQMLEITRGKLADRDLLDRVHFHQGYVDGLPRGEPFDAATLSCVMHFLSDDGSKLALLRTIAGQLRPGGALALVEGYGVPGTAEFEWRFTSWMRFIEAMGMSDQDRATYRAQVDASVQWISESRILELLEEAGFEDVQPFYRAIIFGGWVARRR